MPSLVGGRPRTPRNAEEAQAERVINENRYVSQVYVNRRKVWEGRASSEEGATEMAKHQKAKYGKSKATIVIRESGAEGYH